MFIRRTKHRFVVLLYTVSELRRIRNEFILYDLLQYQYTTWTHGLQYGMTVPHASYCLVEDFQLSTIRKLSRGGEETK